MKKIFTKKSSLRFDDVHEFFVRAKIIFYSIDFFKRLENEINFEFF
jgi:hypothetical protein